MTFQSTAVRISTFSRMRATSRGPSLAVLVGMMSAKLYGRTGSAHAHAIRDFLHRSDMPFEWIEVPSDEEARALGLDGLHDPRLPVCEFPDGTRMEHPTIRQITEKLGWFHDPSRSEYDVAIYGAGPAGLSAAVYSASEGLETVVIERWAVGGQAGSSPKIENYLGFPGGVSGADLAERAREQACRFGAEILIAREGVRGEFSAGKRVGILEDGTKIVPGRRSVRPASPTDALACPTKIASSGRASTTARAPAKQSCVARSRWSSLAAGIRPPRRRFTLPSTPGA